MKVKAAFLYSAKPILIGFAVTYVCTAFIRLTPLSFMGSVIDSTLFFLAGAFTFPQRTDSLIQCGVSREKQYAVLWMFGIFAVLASILELGVQGVRTAVFEATSNDFFEGPLLVYTTYYSKLVSVLLYGAVILFRNLAGLFSGHLVGILQYRFLRAGSRLNWIVPILLVLLPIGMIRSTLLPYYLVGTTEHIKPQMMASPLRWTLYFWGRNFFLSGENTVGDSTVFSIGAPLFYTVTLASLCCIFLRSLPVRRSPNA